MKHKLISIVALFILMFVASACGDKQEGTKDQEKTNATEESTEENSENTTNEENTTAEQSKDTTQTEVVPYEVTYEQTYAKTTDSGWLDGIALQVETDSLDEEELLAIGKDVINTYFATGEYDFFIVDINETDKPDSFTHELMSIEQDFPNGQAGELKYKVLSDAVK